MKNKKSSGFTLIEILIAIAIIGILVGILITYLGGVRSKGRDSRRIADLKQIEQALEVYFDSCYIYPTTLTALSGNDCTGKKIFAEPVPDRDPQGVLYGYYTTTSGPKKYHACATLELGYTGGIGKAGQGEINSSDECDGTANNIFDVYGPR